MKIKSLFALLSLVLLFTSCSKEMSLETGNKAPDGKYFFRFKLDGVLHDYSAQALAFTETFSLPDGTSTTTQMLFMGKPTLDDNDLSSFGISLTTDKTITIGNYSELSDPMDYFLIAMMTGPDLNSESYSAAGMQTPPASEFILKLTTLTATEAGGTFSGSVYDDNGLGSNVKMVTEGEFFVRFL